MSHESNRIILDRAGQPCPHPTTADLDSNGSLELFDADGMRIPAIDIPDSAYFPDLTIFEPTPEDQGDLTLTNRALADVVYRAKETIWAACTEDPARLNHALAMLDEALTHFETLAECPDPDPILTHAMREGVPKRLPWHVAMANGQWRGGPDR